MPDKKQVPTLEDFELGDEVAWGSLATIVDAVYKRNDKHYALKILNKAQLLKKKVIQTAMVEKDALIALGTRPQLHPGIIRLHHCFQDQAHLYFALDLATNGDLKVLVQKYGSISLGCARYYTAQLVDAVQYLHDSGVVHRDIKPENLLLDNEWRIKICDFGCAHVGKDLETSRTNTFVGTAAYISPEMLSRSKTNPKSPDLWAIGCTLYFFFYGASPFMAATDYLTMERVKSLSYSIPEQCDADAAALIHALLVVDPTERLGLAPKSSAQELRRHSFFVGRQNTDVKKSPPTPTPWSVIDWDVLWTASPPQIEAGTYRPAPRQKVTTDELWESFEGLQVVAD